MATQSALRSESSDSALAPDAIDGVIDDVRNALARQQRDDGHWLFELEADATIPADFIMLEHYLDEIDDIVEAKLAKYLRRTQSDRHGGWPLFYGGDFDLSATVKAYYALKLTGDDPEAEHMRRARDAVLAHGGAAHANVFTRIALAQFGQVPWRAVPVMPVEIMLLPRWFPFHMSKVSYWSRTVIAPLLVLMTLKAQAKNPRGVDIRELFTVPPEEEEHYNRSATDSPVATLFMGVDRILRAAEPVFPKGSRERAINAAMKFVRERLNGEDGLGGIYPAMANAVMAMEALGYPKDHPDLLTAKASIRKLLVLKEDEGYCQPCLSPVWDTGLAAHTMMEAGLEREDGAVSKAGDWLMGREIKDVVGDWAEWRPGLKPGGWAFQYWNDYYPDVDDTAVVAMALDRIGDPKYRDAVARAEEWIVGMQSKDGGWGAFDADNTYHYLNHIPFADHGALLDPPTEDVTARCLSFLLQIGRKPEDPVVARGLEFLRRTQEKDGSWYGRWGTNYVYGTWSVLCAFNAAGIGQDDPAAARAVAWLKSRQHEDGGWGEGGETYWDEKRDYAPASTPSQTAWALLGLMAAGEVDSDAVERGIEYLMNAPRNDTRWEEEWYTAVGFPRVFYLRYHGYSAYFPLWALARYRNLQKANDATPHWGM